MFILAPVTIKRAGKRVSDSVHHTVDVVEYIVVPKPEHRESLLYEPRVTIIVVGNLMSMLPAIEFDNESLRQANKIDDIYAKRLLTTELAAEYTATSQFSPQPLLGFCHIFP